MFLQTKRYHRKDAKQRRGRKQSRRDDMIIAKTISYLSNPEGVKYHSSNEIISPLRGLKIITYRYAITITSLRD